mmetsp:Transcript_6119/g.24450  ORF Transcript_6119/g.24450 Transcript_6119/m.24450 type:complete len:255 (+) Transcript_6119:1083-1847(+)
MLCEVLYQRLDDGALADAGGALHDDRERRRVGVDGRLDDGRVQPPLRSLARAVRARLGAPAGELELLLGVARAVDGVHAAPLLVGELALVRLAPRQPRAVRLGRLVERAHVEDVAHRGCRPARARARARARAGSRDGRRLQRARARQDVQGAPRAAGGAQGGQAQARRQEEARRGHRRPHGQLQEGARVLRQARQGARAPRERASAAAAARARRRGGRRRRPAAAHGRRARPPRRRQEHHHQVAGKALHKAWPA